MHTGLTEVMLYIKQERILGVVPPALSVSSLSSQMRPGMSIPCVRVHTASRFASGPAPVQFNGIQFPTYQPYAVKE
jgi:hypothetical protein